MVIHYRKKALSNNISNSFQLIVNNNHIRIIEKS